MRVGYFSIVIATLRPLCFSDPRHHGHGSCELHADMINFKASYKVRKDGS